MRTTGAAVKLIFETDLSAEELEPFIETASELIDNNDDLAALDSDLLIVIEKWLAAHFAAAWDQRITYQSYGISKVKFQGDYGKSLNATDYGQTAIALDPSGTLQDIANGVKTAHITAYPVTYPSEYGSEDDYRG